MNNGTTYDIAVLGLGGIGAMAAWRAAARGARVIGIERFQPGHAHGSSHGKTRIFRETLFEGRDYIPLVQRSRELWRQLEKDAAASLFRRSGGLCIGPADGPAITVALDSARAGGFAYELLEHDELVARYPQYTEIPGDVAVFEHGAGILYPEECIRAAVRLAQAAGADIVLQTTVEAIRPDDTGVTLVAGGDRVRARKAIVATGAWFNELLPQLELPMEIQRSPHVWFTGPRPEEYQPDRFPVFIRKSTGLDCWGVPDTDGTGVKVGAGSYAEKPWLENADDNDYPIDERDTGPAEDVCRRGFPGLTPVAAHAEPCMNLKTPDRDFILGIPDEAPPLVLAAGFSGHGFKHASGSGDVCVDLALDGATDLPLAKFAPGRFADEGLAQSAPTHH